MREEWLTTHFWDRIFFPATAIGWPSSCIGTGEDDCTQVIHHFCLDFSGLDGSVRWTLRVPYSARGEQILLDVFGDADCMPSGYGRCCLLCPCAGVAPDKREKL